MAKKAAKKETTGANIGFEAKLWLAADKLRSNMDASEYKHVVLGLIFLKYISDTFDEHHATLVAGKGQYDGANPEDPDEYKAEKLFWVPQEARWIVIPSLPLIRAFTDIAKPMFDRINRNTEQSRTLATLRDTLLPKLLSGELSVASVERSVEVAL